MEEILDVIVCLHEEVMMSIYPLHLHINVIFLTFQQSQCELYLLLCHVVILLNLKVCICQLILINNFQVLH